MDHHPGTTIVTSAADALAKGGSITIYISGMPAIDGVRSISTTGPFAKIDKDYNFTLVRLDHLIGVQVTLN